jgi:hypothetical protein
MIRHIVALKFKPGVTEAKKAELYAALKALDGHIDGIIDFRSFRNVSIETPVVRGFNDLFWFDFRDATVRDTYVVDPEHQKVGARIVAETEGGPDGVYVFDVEM